MDDGDRDEVDTAVVDVTAIATVAIQGIVGLCAELDDAGVLTRAQLSRISEFMLASLERSGASEQLQAHLHQAIGHQFAALVARPMQRGNRPQEPEG